LALSTRKKEEKIQMQSLKIAQRAVQLAAVLLLSTLPAHTTEKGGSVWPVGAESVAMATAVPHKGQTEVYNYNAFYEANQMTDGNGKKLPIPDFKLSHNWGVDFLGGQIGSWIAVPNVYEQLHVPGAKFTNNAVGNINIVPFAVFNHQGIANWYYELQFETPGSGYQSGAALNIGQHNAAMTPSFGMTLTPHHLVKEISSRVDYVVNDPDHVSHYHSGNEFFWQFDSMREVPHTKASIGAIGYFYQQVTNDTSAGAPVVSTNADGTSSIGYKGRALDLGAQVSMPIGRRGGMAFKWERDTLVQNKPQGNAFWFQFAVPFSYLHHPAAVAH
jgi:hypothetical protein